MYLKVTNAFTFQNGSSEQCGVVYPKPRPDLTFVFAIHYKSRANNIYAKKLPWISRAS